ncbi:MAG: PAS domain S-box protein [Candidatus Auribacterota bacterium]|nr:PAS domain S-box protein [Candidatus Auribacterota bacterium]
MMKPETKNKNPELQLAYLSQAVERLGEMVIVNDLDNRITYVNPAAEEILGYTPRELIGRHIGDIFDNIVGDPPHLAPWSVERDINGIWRGEVLNRKKDGSIINVHLTLSWLRDRTGEIIGCVGVSRDITRHKEMEVALRESEERFRNLTEYIPGVSIQGYRPDGTVFFWNKASEEIYGYSPSEAIGKNLGNLIIPPDLKPLFLQSLGEGGKVIKSGEFLPAGELILKDKKGHPVSVYSIHTAVYAEGKEPELFCIDVDLSERKKMEAALRQAHDQLEERVKRRTTELEEANTQLKREMAERERIAEALSESEERFRTIFDNAKDAIFIEAIDGKILDVNKAVCSMLGYTREELLNKRVGDIVPPEVAADFASVIQKESIKEGVYLQTEDVRKDGTRIPIEVSNTLVSINGQERVIAIARDISERIRADDELRKFKTIADEANYGTAIADLEGNLIYLNRHFAWLHQYTPEELIGKNLSVLHTEEQMETVIRLNTRLKSDGAYYAEEVWHKKKDGTVFPTMMNATIIPDEEGKPQFLSATTVDITGKIRAEEEKQQIQGQLRQAQKMESAARMAGGMAHDFGNLLNAIRGYVEIIKNQLHAEDPLQYEIRELDNTVIRAGTLIRKLLSFGRRQAIQPENINLNAIITDIAGMLRRVCGRTIDMDFALSPGLSIINADAGQMEQIIINLVINAKDSVTEQGKITIKTASAELSNSLVPRMIGKKAGEYVVLVVEDNGRGMDEMARSKIFEPFFTTKDADNSSGLGLSIVYGIVEQSGGFIQMDSTPGRGTIFRIYFPAVTTANILPEADLIPGERRILIMDDDAELRSATGKLLASLGCLVSAAEDGKTAIELFKNEMKSGRPFDAVLLDLIIPGKIGGEVVVKSLRKIDPAVKAILCSGYRTDPIISDYQKYGFSGVLTKPFKREELMKVLMECLGDGS